MEPALSTVLLNLSSPGAFWGIFENNFLAKANKRINSLTSKGPSANAIKPKLPHAHPFSCWNEMERLQAGEEGRLWAERKYPADVKNLRLACHLKTSNWNGTLK